MPDLTTDHRLGSVYGTGACKYPFYFLGYDLDGVKNVYIKNADIFGLPNGYYNIEGIFNEVYNSFHSMLEFECVYSGP